MSIDLLSFLMQKNTRMGHFMCKKNKKNWRNWGILQVQRIQMWTVQIPLRRIGVSVNFIFVVITQMLLLLHTVSIIAITGDDRKINAISNQLLLNINISIIIKITTNKFVLRTRNIRFCYCYYSFWYYYYCNYFAIIN